MKWELTIKSEPSGMLAVTGIAGEIPAGTLTVTGSDDGNRIHLAVHQHDAEGRFVTSAEHTLDRADKALREAETDAETITAAGGSAGISVAVEGEIAG